MGTFDVKICTANGTDWVSGSEVEIAASESLYFGSSSRSTYAKKINVNSWNDSMHVATSTSNTAVDKCGAPHAHNLKYVSADAVSIDNGANSALTALETCEAVRIHFNATSCTVDEAQFWFGSGADVGSDPSNASCMAFEKGSSNWSEPKPGNKLALSTGGPSTDHYWYMGLSIKPTDIGFNNLNKFKVEVTYS